MRRSDPRRSGKGEAHRWAAAGAAAALALLWLGSAGPLTGGTGYELFCESGECSHSWRVNFGGGFRFAQRTAYCVATGEFVYLRWGHDEPAPEPIPVWDPRTGETIELYDFPECPHPAMAIARQQMRCPRCPNAEPRWRALLAYD